MAPRNIDRQRADLLARRDELQALVHDRIEADDPIITELESIDEQLPLLDEFANRGDDRPYPRVKIRKIRRDPELGWLNPPEGSPWLITQVDAPELDNERVLAWQGTLPAAHDSATAYVQVQQHLARMIGGVL